jgi:acetylornithine deacetylase/succinyl-diaminopimelate desuccinylase-like protein
VQLAEKVYQSFRLEVKDPGGHSSVPRRDNPIYRLSEALARLGKYDFAPHLIPVTRAYFERVAATEDPEVAAAMKALLAGSTDAKALEPLSQRAVYNAQMRTTCVATLLEAGHAENALPQTARATVNCRILPDEAVDDVERQLVGVIADPKVALTRVGTAVLSPPSPMDPEVVQAVEGLTSQMWPGVPAIPTMSTGYTDSRWLRNAGIPAYGVSGLFIDPGRNGVHGLNEQIGVKALYDGRIFLYGLVKTLSSKGKPPATN